MLSPVVGSEEADEEQKEDPLMAYPEGGYWALAPGCHLRMLRALCCDALDTAIIRCSSCSCHDIAWRQKWYLLLHSVWCRNRERGLSMETNI